jgi:hypothetical protein
MCTIFWFGNLKGKGHLEDLEVDGILECILGNYDRKMLTKCIWLRIGPSGGLM